MISDQIAPHLVQLPSKIISTNPLPYNFINILNHIYLLDFSCLPQLVLSAKKENIKSSINQEYLTLTTNNIVTFQPKLINPHLLINADTMQSYLGAEPNSKGLLFKQSLALV